MIGEVFHFANPPGRFLLFFLAPPYNMLEKKAPAAEMATGVILNGLSASERAV
jgi:hypothetical protein